MTDEKADETPIKSNGPLIETSENSEINGGSTDLISEETHGNVR